MGGNRSRKGLGFDISAQSNQFVWRHGVINTLRGLIKEYCQLRLKGVRLPDLTRCQQYQY